MGEMVTVGHGRGYLARPGLEEAPGVLLFHPWWGLNDFMKELADRLSAEGYVVLAPDYVLGRVASTVEEAENLASGVDWDYAYGLAGQAVDYLLADDAVVPKDLAAIGFSLGAGPTLGLAGWRPDAVRAVVLFYGVAEGNFEAMRANFQCHFAENDAYEEPEYVAYLQEQLAMAGLQVEFHTYPGTGHWFFESNRPDAYDAEAATQAWQRTLRFLKEEIA